MKNFIKMIVLANVIFTTATQCSGYSLSITNTSGSTVHVTPKPGPKIEVVSGGITITIDCIEKFFIQIPGKGYAKTIHLPPNTCSDFAIEVDADKLTIDYKNIHSTYIF